MTYRQIAAEMGVSPQAAHNYIASQSVERRTNGDGTRSWRVR